MIVGLSGPQGAGKSTLAHSLVHELDSAFVYSLATPLRQMAEIVVGEPCDKLKTYTIGDVSLTGRQVLQRLGTEVGRNISRTVWVDLLLRRIARGGFTVSLVDDVRFVNERDACDFGVWVESSDATCSDTHASEHDQAVLREAADLRLYRAGHCYRCEHGKALSLYDIAQRILAGACGRA
jgi:hypothetical protein